MLGKAISKKHFYCQKNMKDKRYDLRLRKDLKGTYCQSVGSSWPTVSLVHQQDSLQTQNC